MVQRTGVGISTDSPSIPTGICGWSASMMTSRAVRAVTSRERWAGRSSPAAWAAVSILTPTTPSAAFGIGEKGRADPTEMYLNDIFTVTVNMAGLPGISVPSGLDAHGLPLGLQVIGRPFAEETLFALGAVIEKADGRFIPERWW